MFYPEPGQMALCLMKRAGTANSPQKMSTLSTGPSSNLRGRGKWRAMLGIIDTAVVKKTCNDPYLTKF